MTDVREEEAPPVEVRDLVSAFGSHVVHDHLSLTVNRGEVRLFGHDISEVSYAQWTGIERRWGVLFQHGALLPR